MNQLRFLSIALITIVLISGCSEKFKVAAPYKNITVVYGFLDMADTAHYIRIQKAFLDQEKSAINMAQTPDSSFYNNISVWIERFDYYGSVTPHDVIPLTRVDLDLEGYPKQPGVFFQSPNYAYKFTDKLDDNYFYRIKIKNLSSGEVDSSDAPVINDVDTVKFYIDAFEHGVNLHGMDFASTFASRYYEFDGNYYSPPNFNFNGESSPVAITEAIIRFNWADSSNITHALTYHSYDYNMGLKEVKSGLLDYQAKNLELYNALNKGMGPAPANIFRLLDRCDIFVYLSTSAFYKYQQASLTQGTGLTGSEIEPVYTNMKGANVLGLYTSRGMRTAKITITPGTIDSLRLSPILQDTRISGTTY